MMVVLSPRSPISAAFLYTNAMCCPQSRIAPDRRIASLKRGPWSALNGRLWFVTKTSMPAESLPRTSSRSNAERAVWIDISPGRELGSGVPPARSRTASAVRRRSCSIAQSESRTSSSDEFRCSRSMARWSRCWSIAVRASLALRISPSIANAEDRSKTSMPIPGTLRSSRSVAANRSAVCVMCATIFSGSSMADRRKVTAELRRVRVMSGLRISRCSGPRRTAMMPHILLRVAAVWLVLFAV